MPELEEDQFEDTESLLASEQYNIQLQSSGGGSDIQLFKVNLAAFFSVFLNPVELSLPEIMVQ